MNVNCFSPAFHYRHTNAQSVPLVVLLAKKDGELWSTNKKVIGAHIDPPKWNFGAI